jgi:predicted alpha/beta superfamily hydrolase
MSHPAGAQYVLHSDVVGRDFVVKVTPPFGPTTTGQRSPVIYALDGGYEIAGPMAWIIGGGGGMTQAFVVEISYAPQDYQWRTTDLTYLPPIGDSTHVKPGGAEFERFLTEELRPFIATRYPVNDRQAYLFGHSLAGLFAANILSERPASFAGYILASPSVWADPGIVDRVKHGASAWNGQRVFIAVGGAETPRMLDGERSLAAALSNEPGRLQVMSKVYPAGSHISYYPALITEAFPWLLPPPR